VTSDEPPPIALALDTGDLDTATAWAAAAGPHVSAVKVGLELFLRHGHEAVRACRSASGGRAVFLDLKIHDIPNTAAGAARAVAALAPDYLTVHASGGPAMVAAVAEALPDTVVVAVTVLTSLSEDDLAQVGMAGPPLDAAVRLADLGVGSGARGVVCSPLEVAAVRAVVGPSVTLITPGVRPKGSELGDQARVATPARALADGADLLVVGRPVTGARDVRRAAAELAWSLPS
jgi:orotidine-5'-phosphate decarboxylase